MKRLDFVGDDDSLRFLCEHLTFAWCGGQPGYEWHDVRFEFTVDFVGGRGRHLSLMTFLKDGVQPCDVRIDDEVVAHEFVWSNVDYDMTSGGAWSVRGRARA